MKHKSTTPVSNLQLLPAGMSPADNNIEFVGQKPTKTVVWFQFGNAHTWSELPKKYYKACEELFLTDIEAVRILPNHYKDLAHNVNRLTELYIYHMYGGCDQSPDMIDGVLQPCENFRETKDCLSLEFDNKYIDINGIHLSQRDLKILDMAMENMPDKLIAHHLGITLSTFDFHKKNLFKKLGIDSKVSFVIHGLKNHILCES
ncbi:helix-turn-helix transcriptional regulator [Winogradskyella pulchriflava]|uniref:Helix-turn-helix transcriptional regulator n=1 Tax=Winogradskyella pulchriflava TaxID=1110688 RepID=A0ABV6QC92_9FLAO